MKSMRVSWIAVAAVSFTLGCMGVRPVASPKSTPQSTDSAENLIGMLAHAYRTMDYMLYRTLFANKKDHGVEFHFVLEQPTTSGETQWGYDEEMRIHRRMFQPQTLGAGEKPVPSGLWPRTIACKLARQSEFVERFDLYRSEQNPMGELDRHRWRATDAVYSTSVLWSLQSGTAFQVEGQARFVVIEDLAKASGEPGKFLVYRWEDLGSGEKGLTTSR
jgi:hypothetical protein